MVTEGRTVRVLIVDDDPAVREALHCILDDEGYDVLEAADGVEALGVLLASVEPLVITLDHVMPRLDGPGLLAFVVGDPALAASCAFVSLTADSRVIAPDLERRLWSLRAPVLRKSVDLDHILQAVAAAAHRLPAEGSA